MIENSKQELLFPALPTYREYHPACADLELTGARVVPRPASPLSPSKKLLFKDAVLKRNTAREGSGTLAMGSHSRAGSYHDQHHSREGSSDADSRLDQDIKLNSHRHKLVHRHDRSNYDRRHSEPFELSDAFHRYECQFPRADNVQHGGDCRCLPPRSPNYAQPRLQPSRESCPTLGLEDALYR